MRKLILILLLTISGLNAQVTGLAGWNIFLDPGHSRTENMGVNGYSEAEEVLRTSLNLREILLTQTDIDTVWSARYNDNVQVSLYERTLDANNRSAAWYHSIHSNAGAPSHNNVLLLWGELYNGTPDPPVGGEAMSDIMIELLADVMRLPSIGSRGDCSFYAYSGACTASWPGPYLYVNRNTNMPSELSEQGHHTNPLQNQLAMNEEYKRMMAYSMFWTILDKFGLDRPFPGILAGLITDTETGQRINGATVTVNGESYTTDTYESLFHLFTGNPDAYHNGFYFFEDLPDSSYEVIVAAEGYYADTLQVNTLVDDFVTFQDIQLLAHIPPVIASSEPSADDPRFPAWETLVFNFNRAMDEASTEAAFSITPAVSGVFDWANLSKRLSFIPDDTLAYESDFSITILGTAHDVHGHQLDGNYDGIGGDDWTISFHTSPPDITAPVLVSVYPADGTQNMELRPMINISYDEELEPNSIDPNLIKLERLSDLHLIEGRLEHYVIHEKSTLVFYAQENLLPSENYRLRIFPGLEDLFGNATSSGTLLTYRTANYTHTITTIDNFDSSISNTWLVPQQSGSTTGIITELTSVGLNDSVVTFTTSSVSSMQLNYGWDQDVSSWLLREYLSGGAPRNVHFNSTKIMQAYVFGDGLGNHFRFCVDDNVPVSAAANHEVSPWYTIDWYGWRLISWDMSVDGTGTWIGDGNLNGMLRFDSFQLTYEPDQPNVGVYYIDELRVVERNYLALDDSPDQQPTEFALLPNYPNPFNPWTNIPFTLPERTEVQISIYDLRGAEVAHIFSGSLEAGRHVTRWNAAPFTSGLYLVKMETNDISITRKLTVLK
ncbi:MAG: Ig-like domain-containing protein [Candidatus Marinimicrobia bacterium]|nr:Ig-like domain-containing protein [Candidatus Neomarinimicrobiota bacterium]